MLSSALQFLRPTPATSHSPADTALLEHYRSVLSLHREGQQALLDNDVDFDVSSSGIFETMISGGLVPLYGELLVRLLETSADGCSWLSQVALHGKYADHHKDDIEQPLRLFQAHVAGFDLQKLAATLQAEERRWLRWLAAAREDLDTRQKAVQDDDPLRQRPDKSKVANHGPSPLPTATEYVQMEKANRIEWEASNGCQSWTSTGLGAYDSRICADGNGQPHRVGGQKGSQ
jgi:hypothetical protein